MGNNLLIVGAGIYSIVALEIAESLTRFDKIDFVDDNASQAPNGMAVIGTVSDIPRLSKEYQNCIVAIGDPDSRLSLIKKVENETDCKIVSLISPRAYVAPSAKIKKGCIVEPMAVVHSMCDIGLGCLVSAGAVVNYASALCDGCHADCNSTVPGGKTVPAKTKLCSGAVFGESSTPVTPVPSGGKLYRSNEVR